LQIIRTHAESTYQDECCGIILGYLANEGKIVSVQNGKAGELQSWSLDDHHQFQAEAIENII
jgi:proteasome lid subunit RPN8/RPN11